MRIAPVANLDGVEDHRLEAAGAEVRLLLMRAEQKQIAMNELQIDFDCAVKDLAVYSEWITKLRKLVTPMKLVITTLPAWLDSQD